MDSAMARHVLISVVSMVRDMDMQVVAEGVETEEQFTCLKDMQCDYMQGYYFSRPIPADSFKQRYLIKGELKGSNVIESYEAVGMQLTVSYCFSRLSEKLIN